MLPTGLPDRSRLAEDVQDKLNEVLSNVHLLTVRGAACRMRGARGHTLASSSKNRTVVAAVRATRAQKREEADIVQAAEEMQTKLVMLLDSRMAACRQDLTAMLDACMEDLRSGVLASVVP